MLVHAGINRTKDKLKIQTIQKLNTRLRPILTRYRYRADTNGIGLVSVSPILQPIPEPIPVDRHAFVMTANAVCWLFTGSRKRSYIDGGEGA